MRGVYFKNMKWQAAIKVDKKQIHLGTVGSEEEAAHLYDRYCFELYKLLPALIPLDGCLKVIVRICKSSVVIDNL